MRTSPGCLTRIVSFSVCRLSPSYIADTVKVRRREVYRIKKNFLELSEYKYAGYSQLIKTIDLEAKDEALFIKGGGDLLSAAIELANYTLISSALNAEQLRRENGLEALVTAFDRCVPMVTMSSTPEDMPVQVCIHVCDCFATSATFEACRQRLAEMPSIFGALCRLLQFSVSNCSRVMITNSITSEFTTSLYRCRPVHTCYGSRHSASVPALPNRSPVATCAASFPL